MPADVGAATFVAKYLSTNAAMVFPTKGGEFNAALVALDRDRIRHPMLLLQELERLLGP